MDNLSFLDGLFFTVTGSRMQLEITGEHPTGSVAWGVSYGMLYFLVHL